MEYTGVPIFLSRSSAHANNSLSGAQGSTRSPVACTTMCDGAGVVVSYQNPIHTVLPDNINVIVVGLVDLVDNAGISL